MKDVLIETERMLEQKDATYKELLELEAEKLKLAKDEYAAVIQTVGDLQQQLSEQKLLSDQLRSEMERQKQGCEDEVQLRL